MDQTKNKSVKDPHAGQVLYLGRWVDKQHFRTFVFDHDGNQKLASNYAEYEAMTQSGLWFAEKPNKYAEVKNVRDIKGKSNASLPNGK